MGLALALLTAVAEPIFLRAHPHILITKGLEMKRRANFLCRFLIAAFVALAFGSLLVPQTVSAQGAIRLGKRQCEQLAIAAACDFDAFYASKSPSTSSGRCSPASS